MATNLLTIGTDTTPSEDFVVASGEQKTICMKSDSGDTTFPNAQILIQIKDDASNYWTVDRLSFTKPAIILNASGTYRLVRKAGGKSAGAFSD